MGDESSPKRMCMPEDISKEVLALHTVPSNVPVHVLDAEAAFAGLTPAERLYAHYVAVAGFEGAKICLFQTSWEAPGIFALLQRLFARGPDVVAAEAAKAGVSEKQVRAFFVYAATFYSNMGNYLSFGDSKFVPGLPQACLDVLIRSAPTVTADVLSLWEELREIIYDLSPVKRGLGFAPEGVNTYYSANCTQLDAQVCLPFFKDNPLGPENTRLVKTGPQEYILRVAAANVQGPPLSITMSDGIRLTVAYGDYAPILQRVVNHLKEALKYAANDIQRAMLAAYIRSFETGDLGEHKRGSEHWVTDKGPAVESYIGFIETYRDPLRLRAEWEGFAAVVNKGISLKFTALVESAESFIELLPWPSSFEKDTFLRPDFTALDVLGFGSSGIPAGINIPNYDDIRQNKGFKNVSLANVLKASLSFPVGERVTFIRENDQELYKITVSHSFDVQVGLHELLGHGSGKLLQQNADGTFNFDVTCTVDPLTGLPPTKWYKVGETYSSQFGEISSSYEECRAESVGLFLCVNEDALRVFGFEGQRASEVTYINWLHMARAGVLALQYFDPSKGENGWGQAHCQARYVILQVLLEAGKEFVKLLYGSEGGIEVFLDRTKIESVGIPAISIFLQKLQVYKATADYASAKAMYQKYSAVLDDMLSLRGQVIAKRQPRRMFVQHVTRVIGEDVELTTEEASVEGLIRSFVARYLDSDDSMLQLWRKDLPVFRL